MSVDKLVLAFSDMVKFVFGRFTMLISNPPRTAYLSSNGPGFIR